MLDMAPRTQEAGTLRVEHDHEGLRIGVELESEVGPPGRGGIPGVEVEPLQDAAKTHPRAVEEPRAVARLEDERHIGRLLHSAILPEGNDKSATGRLRLDDGMRIPSSEPQLGPFWGIAPSQEACRVVDLTSAQRRVCARLRVPSRWPRWPTLGPARGGCRRGRSPCPRIPVRPPPRGPKSARRS